MRRRHGTHDVKDRSIEHDVIPEVLAPGDPSSGDEALPLAGEFFNYVRFGRGEMQESELREAEVDFHDCYLSILAGDSPWGAIAPHATRCRVDWPTKLDRRPPLLGNAALSDEVLADIVEDFVADWPVWLERVTGDPFFAPTPAVVGALAFVPFAKRGRRALDAWRDEEEDRDLAALASIVDRVPPMVWVHGRPLLPLGPLLTPPTVPDGVYVARAYPTRDGWCLSGRMDLPACPSSIVIQRRLELELMRFRLIERRSTWEDALRHRPEVVYRAAMEGARRAASIVAVGPV